VNLVDNIGSYADIISCYDEELSNLGAPIPNPSVLSSSIFDAFQNDLAREAASSRIR